MRIRAANDALSVLVKAANATDYLMARQREIRTIRHGRPFNPAAPVDADAIRKLLEEVLALSVEVGEDEEQSAVRDLVGRANSQTEWKREHLVKLEDAIRPLLDGWTGLLPSGDGPLAGLAALHNPDQVAGGERHLPSGELDFADFIGPALVNTALGATWGLKAKANMAGPLLPPVATTLQERVGRRHPESIWPLLRMNIVPVLKVVEGMHVIPPPPPSQRAPTRKPSTAAGRAGTKRKLDQTTLLGGMTSSKKEAPKKRPKTASQKEKVTTAPISSFFAPHPPTAEDVSEITEEEEEL